MKRFVCGLLLTLAAGSPGLAAEDDAGAVFELIDARLELMLPVAAWKQANDAAVEDKAREAVVVEKAVEAASLHNIDPEGAAVFFRAQIEAAKEIQVCWIERWSAGEATPPVEVPDLKGEIRPQLIEIGGKLLAAVETTLDSGESFTATDLPAFRTTVRVDCLSDETRDTLFEALTQMRLTS